MDGMNNNLGNLSLGATEWKPKGVNTNVSRSTNSDLNAGQVKEFIPGQGWTVSPSNAQVQAMTNAPNEAHIGR